MPSPEPIRQAVVLCRGTLALLPADTNQEPRSEQGRGGSQSGHDGNVQPDALGQCALLHYTPPPNQVRHVLVHYSLSVEGTEHSNVGH